MKLAGIYPIVEGYKGAVSPGYYFHFEDPLQFHQINASLSVSPFEQDARPGTGSTPNFEYKTLNWDFQYRHNGADFYDLFGPVERSRRGDVFIAAYNKTIIYDPPRQLDLFGSARLYFGLEQLPSAQNIASPKNIRSLEVGAKYTNTAQGAGRRRS